MKTVPLVLTIAGSDPGGGAGLQADLTTFSAHGLCGASVVTSLTIQNTQGVLRRHDVEPGIVAEQLEAVLSDRKPAAIKIGMLGNEKTVTAIAGILKKKRSHHLVIDPVVRSTSGKALLSAKGIEAMKAQLFPLADVVTPNLKEAEVLSGVRIRNVKDSLKAAKAIQKLGVRAVLITGGHNKKNADDFLLGEKTQLLLEGERVGDESLHGTGCVLSSAVSANLALGHSLVDSVRLAKQFITQAIQLGVKTGKGMGRVNPMGPLYQKLEREPHLERMEQAIEALKREGIGYLIPEVQSNMGFGLEDATGPEQVAAIPGRIVRDGENIATLHPPRFGASQHVAKIVLTTMRFDPEKRAVMNIKFQQHFLDACKRLKMSTGSFERSREPKNVKQLEGSSLEWGTRQAIEDKGFVPDIIYDLGGQGKEEMIRVIARDVEDLVDRIKKIHRAIQKSPVKKEREVWRRK